MTGGTEASGAPAGAAGAIRSPAGLLVADWTYTPSSPSWRTRLKRWHARLTLRRPMPRHHIVVAPVAAPRWNILFLFLPAGTPDADQHRILARIRRLSGRLLVVYAAPDPAVPDGLGIADALIWKDLPGFDLSAYAIALDTVARHAPGAIVYVQNDSVLGPFVDIDAQVARTRWDLTGFMASAAVENHLSTFAFILRDVTPARVAALAPVLSARWCHDRFDAVVLGQESRLARVAARAMSVGAVLYMPAAPARRPLLRSGAGAYDLRGDPMLGTPLALLDRGFPFVKRSLFGKFAMLADRPALDARLNALGWSDPA